LDTLLRILRTLVLLAAALAAAAALVGIEILAPTKWLPDLATFFMPYFALAAGCVIITVLLILRPRFGLVGLAALIAGVFVSVAPGNTTLSSDGRTLRLTTFNVLFSNPETELLRRYAADMGSDVVLLQEAGWPWPEKTAEWTEFPYRYIREDRRLVVLSKLPLLGEPLPLINTHWEKPRNMNALRIELSLAGRPTGDGAEKLVVFARPDSADRRVVARAELRAPVAGGSRQGRSTRQPGRGGGGLEHADLVALFPDVPERHRIDAQPPGPLAGGDPILQGIPAARLVRLHHRPRGGQQPREGAGPDRGSGPEVRPLPGDGGSRGPVMPGGRA
jgi:hypothetical protein